MSRTKPNSRHDHRLPAKSIRRVAADTQVHPAGGSPEQEQAAFFERMGTRQELRLLFDGMIGVHFFIKDRESRFMAFSQSEHQCFLLGTQDDVIGCTDFDLYPRHVAERVQADDRRVMDSDRPLLNIVELLVNPVLHTIDWYVTNKCPVHDAAGAVIGIMGTVQPYDVRHALLLAGTKLGEAVEHGRRHAVENCSVKDLARIASMSPRQLTRKFSEVLGFTPQEFLLHTRMKRACDELASGSASMAEIAVHCGFCDQSALAVQFRRIIGGTPLEYRQRYLQATKARATV